MKGLSRREIVLLSVLGVLLVFYCYYRLLLLPVLNTMEASRASINTLKKELDSQNLSKLIGQNSKKQLDELKTKIDNALSEFPEDERNPEIAYNIKTIAGNTNVSVIAVGFGQEADLKTAAQNNKALQGFQGIEGIMTVPLTIQVSGDYRNIVNFIAGVEKDKRIAIVNNVAINSLNGTTVQANINANYFYMVSSGSKDVQYDFNKGQYGKDNLFK